MKLYETLADSDHERIKREGILLDVVTDCGGTAEAHDPRGCRQPHCGEFRAARGRERAYGRTPLIALRNLPVV